jgi:hypothetical protein
MTVEILKIEGKGSAQRVYCRLQSGISIWLESAMLKSYGVKAKDIRVGFVIQK